MSIADGVLLRIEREFGPAGVCGDEVPSICSSDMEIGAVRRKVLLGALIEIPPPDSVAPNAGVEGGAGGGRLLTSSGCAFDEIEMPLGIRFLGLGLD